MTSLDVQRATPLDTFESRDPLPAPTTTQPPKHLICPQLILPGDPNQPKESTHSPKLLGKATSHNSKNNSGGSCSSSGGSDGGGGGSSSGKTRQKQRHSLKELNAMRRAATTTSATSNNNDPESRVIKFKLPNGTVTTTESDYCKSGSSSSGCNNIGGGGGGNSVDPASMGYNQKQQHQHINLNRDHRCQQPPQTLSPNLLRVSDVEDDLSDWESPIDVDLANPASKRSHQSSWRKIRSFILWSPFIQVFKKHRYPWIQLAGHQGNFQAGDAGSVLKKLDKREQQCFQHLMSDSLKEYVPEYRGNVDKNGDTFIQLQDLLCTFTYPCVMDIKMGVRTYLEEELHKARKSPALRKDMYQKMTEVDPNAPTEEEHEQKAVTKPRYMQWRDQMSSSAEMGFRVEGIKQSDGKSSKDFKKTKERENIVEIIQSYVGSNDKVVGKYLDRLRQIRRAQESSEFFKSHEVVGSSLLFVHDADASVNIWMIDFGKTEQLPAGMSIDHRSTWVEGNREDGYLFGLDNLVSIFEEIFRNLSSSSV